MPITGRLRSIPSRSMSNPHMPLTLEELPGGCRVRRGGYGAAGHDRHAGTAVGQAPACTLLRERGGRPWRRGLQLPAGRRCGDEHGAGLRHVVLGDGLRRLRVPARSELAAAVPWLERTVLVVADREWEDGSPVAASPRQILRRQLDRLAERGWRANVGSELEFLLFRDSYYQARVERYRTSRPRTPTIVVELLDPGHDHGRRRAAPHPAGDGQRRHRRRGLRRECNFGQHEVNFRYSDAWRWPTTTRSTRRRQGLAHMHGCALSFMAKYDQREGNSCHIHISLWDDKGSLSPGRGRPRPQPHLRPLRRRPARHDAELALLLRPQRQLYKRYAWGSFAPTTVVWGVDNRTCGVRVVGHGAGLRLDSLSAPTSTPIAFVMIAGGPARDRQRARARARLPRQCLRRGRQAQASRQPARGGGAARGLGDRAGGVRGRCHRRLPRHDARTEQRAFEAAVTDWERYRSFERM